MAPAGKAGPTTGKAKAPKLKLPRAPKGKLATPAVGMPSLKMEKSEWQKPCFSCGKHLIENGQLGTCTCLEPIVKSSLFPEPGPNESVILRLGQDITRYQLVKLIEIIKR
jgi:hypothetical protein